jgi:hypothetical protein
VQGALGLGWPPAAWLRAFGWLLVASTALSIGERALRAARGA